MLSGVPRSIVYVDGFNLYYGALKGTADKWLDLQRYFQLLRQHDDLQRIKYFTARILGGDAAKRQATYLRAVATLPLVEVIEGRFKLKEVCCVNPRCSKVGDRLFKSPEEKRTDVNIALHMLDDAYRNLVDTLILVSGDSDLVPAIDWVKARFPTKQVLVYVPARSKIRGAATELRTAADGHRTLPMELLRKCQLPSSVPDAAGGTIAKPTSW